MKPTAHTRWIAGLALFAVVATACTGTESDERSDETTRPETVTTDTAAAVPSTVVTVPVTDPDTDTVTDDDHIDGVVHVTIDEIGVSTVLPSSWTAAPGGGFTDGSGQLSAFALRTVDASDDDLDGFEPLGDVTAGGRVWELHAQQTDEQIVGVASTVIGGRIYGIVLQAPVEAAETQLETVVVPALEAFHVTDVPIGSDPFGTLPTDSVEIDGRTIAYLSAGKGTPTVVFEAGLGSNGLASWALVAPDVAEHARVFAYDRPGYGDSDLTGSPRDGATMVEELRELLATTGHEPPYLLVGHSLGGTLMDLFARTHPDEVAGLVLVDSRHHEYTERCVAQFGPVQCDVPADDEIAGVPEPILGEWRALPDTEAQLAAVPPLSDMPLAVIVAGIAMGSPETFELWGRTQQDYADRVPGSQLIVAEGSDHGIPGQQPQLIIDTIIGLIGATR